MGYTLATTWLLLAIAAIIGLIIGWFLAKKLCKCDDSALRAELNTAKIESNEHKAKVQGLVGQVDSHKSEVAKLKTSGGDVLKHTQRIDQLEAAAAGAATAAAAATLAAKTKHDSEINALKAELTAATTKHAEAESKIQGFAAAGSSASADVTAESAKLSARIAELETEKAKTAASVTASIDDSSKLSARIAELEAEKAKAAASVTAAADGSAKLSARITELEAEKAKAAADATAAVNAATSTASGESAKLAARVAELEAEHAKGLAAAAAAATAAAGAATLSSSKHSEEVAALKAQLSACEAKNAEAQSTIQGFAAAATGAVAPSISAEQLAAGAGVLGLAKLAMDDLKAVEGIGAKTDEILVAGGITTWHQLSNTPLEQIQSLLDAAGPSFRMANPASWPRQAGLLANARWAEFKTLTDELTAGRES
jgi:predicted flap endonuclease-1-like 5' DNA nuclease/uncharacterized membrane-anchored protein YhcB (DUF1043 family)